jgi:hypothetical protein
MSDLETFFNSFQTLPKLISDLAMSMALAQQRMDENYVKSLKGVIDIFAPFIKPDVSPDQFIPLLKELLPAHYQFTNTVFEIRADMQSSTGTSATAGITAGVTVPFAVSVNASYTRRTASDFRASALIRTVVNAVNADPQLTQAMIAAAQAAPGTALPADASPAQKSIQEALNAIRPAPKPDEPKPEKP